MYLSVRADPRGAATCSTPTASEDPGFGSSPLSYCFAQGAGGGAGRVPFPLANPAVHLKLLSPGAGVARCFDFRMLRDLESAPQGLLMSVCPFGLRPSYPGGLTNPSLGGVVLQDISFSLSLLFRGKNPWELKLWHV